jgi:hypothetical protein
MSFLSTALANLNSEQYVLSSGFMIGFIYSFKFNRRTLHYPLSTIFDSALSGYLTLWGAKIVSNYLPSNLRFIIPLAAIASCIYYKFVDMFGPTNNKITGKNDNENEEKKVTEQIEKEYPFVDNKN